MIYTYVPTAADWLRILPQLIVLGAALLTLIVDLFLPASRKAWLYIVALAGVIGAGVATALMFTMGDGQDAFFGMVRSDWTALLAYLIILFAAALGILFSPDYLTRRTFTHHGEYYALLLLSTFGMMLMSAAASLMIVFVGLEALSLPLYILCAILPRDLRSQESGLKYFLLSSFASAFLLYGIALTFGSVGYVEPCRNSRLRDRESIQPHQRLWSDPRRRHWPDGGRSRLQGQRCAVPGMDAGCLCRRASSSDGLHVGGDEGRGVRRHGAHLPRRASARSRGSGSRSSGR